MSKSFIQILLLVGPVFCFAQNILVNTGATPAALVSTLVDPAVTVSNVTQSCKNTQRGTFTNNGSSINMTSGIILTNGKAADVAGPNNEGCGAQSANTSVNGNVWPETETDLNSLDPARTSSMYANSSLTFR